jgi:hypothetical protein
MLVKTASLAWSSPTPARKKILPTKTDNENLDKFFFFAIDRSADMVLTIY